MRGFVVVEVELLPEDRHHSAASRCTVAGAGRRIIKSKFCTYISCFNFPTSFFYPHFFLQASMLMLSDLDQCLSRNS